MNEDMKIEQRSTKECEIDFPKLGHPFYVKVAAVFDIKDFGRRLEEFSEKLEILNQEIGMFCSTPFYLI